MGKKFHPIQFDFEFKNVFHLIQFHLNFFRNKNAIRFELKFWGKSFIRFNLRGKLRPSCRSNPNRTDGGTELVILRADM